MKWLDIVNKTPSVESALWQRCHTCFSELSICLKYATRAVIPHSQFASTEDYSWLFTMKGEIVIFTIVTCLLGIATSEKSKQFSWYFNLINLLLTLFSHLWVSDGDNFTEMLQNLICLFGVNQIYSIWCILIVPMDNKRRCQIVMKFSKILFFLSPMELNVVRWIRYQKQNYCRLKIVNGI